MAYLRTIDVRPNHETVVIEFTEMLQ